jgi:hypothetical protein
VGELQYGNKKMKKRLPCSDLKNIFFCFNRLNFCLQLEAENQALRLESAKSRKLSSTETDATSKVSANTVSRAIQTDSSSEPSSSVSCIESDPLQSTE